MSSTLTLESLQEMMAPIRNEHRSAGLGFGTFGGIKIIESPFLPDEDELIGNHITWTHPFTRWLSRWFPVRTYDKWPMVRRVPCRHVYFLPQGGMIMRPELYAVISSVT